MTKCPPHLRASPAELRSFREAGFLVRPEEFGEDEVEALGRAVERVHGLILAEAARAPSPVERVEGRCYQRLLDSSVQWEWSEESRSVRTMEPFHHLDPRLDALLDDPRLWGPVPELIGAEAAGLFTDKLNFKPPGGSPYPWHQDSTYWTFECGHVDQLVTVGLYLDDANKENGCLWLVPGSHRLGMLPPPDHPGTAGRLYTDMDRLEGAEPLPLEAPAGSVMFSHAHIVHGSKTNRSQSPRRALYPVYQPAGQPRWHFDEPRLPVADR